MKEPAPTIQPATSCERKILGELARRVADVASLPIQAERIRLLKSSNDLRPERPVVLWQGLQACWREMIPESELTCSDPVLRGWERTLRGKLFRHRYVPTDNPITAELVVSKNVLIGTRGLVAEFRGEENRRTNTGSFAWEAPVRGYDDVGKLHMPDIRPDQEETQRRIDHACDLFHRVLDVRPKLNLRWSYGLTEQLAYLRGLEQMMIDLYENPTLIHELMGFLRDEAIRELEFYERKGLLTLNNGPEDIVTNGLGATDDLPAPDFDGRTRLQDLWVLSESQEFSGVGPDQFDEFALEYQLPVVTRFGLCAYGCCEPLDRKYDLLIERIPNLRRVSVSPWADRGLAAEKLGNRYVYSWKPNPSRICARVPDLDAAQKDVVETLEMAQGCCLQISLNDTPTFHHDPNRLKHWSEMALSLVQ
jgi:hypothetical protein